jgi:hypothetical protein
MDSAPFVEARSFDGELQRLGAAGLVPSGDGAARPDHRNFLAESARTHPSRVRTFQIALSLSGHRTFGQHAGCAVDHSSLFVFGRISYCMHWLWCSAEARPIQKKLFAYFINSRI